MRELALDYRSKGKKKRVRVVGVYGEYWSQTLAELGTQQQPEPWPFLLFLFFCHCFKGSMEFQTEQAPQSCFAGEESGSRSWNGAWRSQNSHTIMSLSPKQPVILNNNNANT